MSDGTVFVVLGNWDYEGSDLDGVYEDEPSAIAAAQQVMLDRTCGYDSVAVYKCKTGQRVDTIKDVLFQMRRPKRHD